jgi:hypothetical protein
MEMEVKEPPIPMMRRRAMWESQFLSQAPHSVLGKPLSNYITHDGLRNQVKLIKLEYPKQVIRVSEALGISPQNLHFFATKFHVRFWDDYTELILPALEAFKLSLQVITGKSGPDSDRVKIDKTIFSKTSFTMVLMTRYIISTAMTAEQSTIPKSIGPDGLALSTGENVKVVNRPLILGRSEAKGERPWEDKMNPEYWDSDGNSRSGRDDQLSWD